VARRSIPVGLVLAAALLGGAGSHTLSVYALLAAVPAVAVAALGAFGDWLEEGTPLGQASPGALGALLWGLALCFVVAASASRPLLLMEGAASGLAHSALVACLVALSLESIVALVAQARQPAPELSGS